jgi:hypothetical protein
LDWIVSSTFAAGISDLACGRAGLGLSDEENMKGPEMQFMRVISTYGKRIELYLASCPKFIEIDKSDGCIQKRRNVN